ncbi:MAG: hypothetical protein KKH68_05755, partial [Proteobacteria bacterium]|nr:hypothetical protein [Pseudomonadota bacterium]
MFLISGCSQVPKPATYPLSYQQKMQAAKHWDILAKDVAGQVARFLQNKDKYILNQEGLYVQPQPGVFGNAFSEMLIAHLLKNGIKVNTTKEDYPVLEFKAQLIKHE